MDCTLNARVASLKLMCWVMEANIMISVEAVHDKTSAVVTRHEQDSSAPSGLSSSVFHREHRCNSQAWN